MTWLDGHDASGNPLPIPSCNGVVAVSGLTLLGTARAVGHQHYTLAEKDGTRYWEKAGPSANLADDVTGANVVGHDKGGHGPRWTAYDGSFFEGYVVQEGPEYADKINELLLYAASKSSAGLMSHVDAVQRLHPTGGLPAPGEENNHDVGAHVSVPYEATYAFWGSLPNANHSGVA
jgi:hypothetical protein